MKRSKVIIRFLEKNDSESIRELLTGLYLDWRASTTPQIKIEQYTESKINEICGFISELDEYLWHGQFSELGFYILVKQFFEGDSFTSRERFMTELLDDWKRNSEGRKKGKKIRKVKGLVSFLYELNRIRTHE